MAHTPKPSHELRDATNALKEDVIKLGRITKNMAQETMDHLKENASDYYQQGKEKAMGLEKSLEVKIKESPMKAVLIAAGVGLVLGALLKKR